MSQSPPAEREREHELEHEAYLDGHEHEGEHVQGAEHDLVESTPYLTVDCDVPSSVQSSPAGATLTRTIAIIKNHALDHRLDIEHRILESKFEIVKERQMEFDTDSDPETMFELFGEDAQFLGDGPVWVYVLERRRAVQVLRSLLPSLGDTVITAQDDTQAEMQIASVFASSPPFHVSDLPPESPQYDPSSMRSVSSAVLEALRLGASEGATTPSVTSSHSNNNSPGNSRSRPRLSSNGTSGGSNPHFKAREIPRTHTAPDIAPRLTKAAMLRLGMSVDEAGKKAHVKSASSVASTGRLPTVQRQKTAEEVAAEKERARQTFANVPGHKRAGTIAVASTAAPAIQPRLTKAAQLRLGIKEATPPPGKRRVSAVGTPSTPGTPRSGFASPARSASVSAAGSPISKVAASPARSIGNIGSGVTNLIAKVRATAAAQAAEMDDGGEDTETEARRRNMFDGVPGHKRRESIQVASLTKAPSIAPRLNRSAALRKEGVAPPSSFMFRTPSTPKSPGSAPPSRSGSAMSLNGSGNANANGNGNGHSRSLSRSSSRAGAGVSRPSLSNAPSSYTSNASSTASTTRTTSSTTTTSSSADDRDGTAGAQRPPPARRLSSLGAPSIAPRPNKSAMLRAQKMSVNAVPPPAAKVFR